MQLVLICVGKLKEAYWRDAAQEYLKRLSRFHSVEVVELPDERAPERLSAVQRAQVVGREGERIVPHLQPRDYIIALTIEGSACSSEAFAGRMAALKGEGHGRLVFLIGGSLGLSPACIAKSDMQLSLSAMTLPHQLARVVLLEQIYRAEKINNNEAYHK